MNHLAYSNRGHSGWKVAMPTFLIDGCDVCEWLELTNSLQPDVVGVGAVELADPFINPQRTVLHRLAPGSQEPQSLLSIHLGDIIGHFVTVNVRAGDDTVE